MSHEYKIVFTGVMGSGKTTAVSALSEKPAISTDVPNTDDAVAKPTTTVGFDYGELTLDNGDRLRLYGTPGQRRFGFLWGILSQGALGVVILVDNSRPQPLEDLSIYLDNFADLIKQAACVVGVGRVDTHPEPDLDAHAARLAAHGLVCPVLAVDVRERSQVLALVDLLLVQLENKLA